MREIKFRIWDTVNKEWFDETVAVLGQDGRLKFWDMAKRKLEPLEEGTYIPLQYTGLKDKNGKEIYGGDIIEATEQEINRKWPAYDDDKRKKRRVRWGVYWNKAGYSLKGTMEDLFYPKENPLLQHFWEFEEKGKTKITEAMVDRSGFAKRDCVAYTNFKIIGNIYENPELLK